MLFRIFDPVFEASKTNPEPRDPPKLQHSVPPMYRRAFRFGSATAFRLGVSEYFELTVVSVFLFVL